MKIRPILFWSHLTAGVLAGLIVLFLSITGVLLTYEHQIVHMFAKSETVVAPEGGHALSVDNLASIASERSEGARMIMLNIENREGAPVVVHPLGQVGLEEFRLNPYTGGVVDSKANSVQHFFETIVKWHRFFGMEGKSLPLGRTITGVANLIFFFLLISGIYLWLPRIWKWSTVRAKMLFRRGLPSRARDYNWHHVFSFWALIPLFFIIFSAVVISFPWANALFYSAYGEEAPKRGGPALLGDLQKDMALSRTVKKEDTLSSLQKAFEAAKATDENWETMYIFVSPKVQAPIARIMVNTGDAILPQDSSTVVYDRRNSSVVEIQKYDDKSAAEKGRMWIRFVHTGQEYGIIGSTIAGLASLAACFLVYTGLALSYRRLLQPIIMRRRNSVVS